MPSTANPFTAYAKPSGARFVIGIPLLVLLLLLFSLPVHAQGFLSRLFGSGDTIPNLYKQDPHEYYADPNNVGRCPSCDQAYFNNPSNLNAAETLEAQKRFFATPGNAVKAPQGVQVWLRRLKVEAAVDLTSGGKDLVFNLDTKTITNGQTSINPSEYPKGTVIKALTDGGFSISNTNLRGFEKVSFDKATGSFSLDGATVRVAPAPKEGQTIEAVRDTAGTIASIKLPPKTTYELPGTGTPAAPGEAKTGAVGARILTAKEPLTLYLDGRDPHTLAEAAVSISGNGDTIKVNKLATAHIQRGDLLVFASQGRYTQKTFPGVMEGSIELQDTKGKLITLQSKGMPPHLIAQIKERSISYDPSKPRTYDPRRDLVLQAQKLLIANGANLGKYGADGRYGKLTTEAVRRFQEDYIGVALRTDGVLDEATLAALDAQVAIKVFSQREGQEQQTWSTGISRLREPDSSRFSPPPLPLGTLQVRFKEQKDRERTTPEMTAQLEESLRTVFAPSPSMRDIIINSGYGDRIHPISEAEDFHEGIDIKAPLGTAVGSITEGTVVSIGSVKGYGKRIVIEHPNSYRTSYSHLNSFAPGLRRGSTVAAGQPIGKVGKTGSATGPHLHFEVIKNGKKVNPGAVTF